MIPTLSKTEIIIFVTFNLSSANAFYSVWSKILSNLLSAEVLIMKESKICLLRWVNLLPNDKYLDWSELEAFADDKINVT